MKNILALTIGALLINLASAQSLNCTQNISNGTTYNSCNFTGIQGDNSAFAGVGAPTTPVPLSNHKSVAGTQIEQSVADRQANFASGGSLYQQAVAEEKTMRENVAKTRAQMPQIPSQDLTPYQAQLVAKIKATNVPTTSVDPYPQNNGSSSGFAGVGAPATPVPLSNYKTVAGTQIEQSVADRQANFASGGSLYQQAVAEEKAMRDNVAKIRAQMAQ